MLQFLLMPESTHGQNLRKNKKSWKITRQKVLKRDNYKCIYCQAKAVHVHEHWQPNRSIKSWKLIALESICWKCHMFGVHWNFAKAKGWTSLSAKQHVCKINNWTIEQFDAELAKAEEQLVEDNKYMWYLDLNYVI